MKPTHRLKSKTRSAPSVFLGASVWALVWSCFPLLAADRPNVLMIAVDDLRPELGCYGVRAIHSPNIDALAASGVRFDRAYCSVAVCGASRSSLLSGCRPETTNCWDYDTSLRSQMPDVLTLPGHFKTHGYHTAFLGKVYHSGSDDRESWNVDVDQLVPADRKLGKNYLRLDKYAALYAASSDPKKKPGPSTENGGDVPDNAYGDGHNAERAVKLMEHFAQDGKPFFLAVGFRKPHLPFVAPAKYWNLYERSQFSVPSREKMKGSVPWARSTWGELKHYLDIGMETDVVSDKKTRQLIHGYYAATSYIDAQVGHLIRGLQKNGLSENTIVLLWGDHGWYLGDYGEWCKHTNYEIATRVPLIFYVPETIMPAAQQGGSIRLVELLDIYPTLCELAGLPTPEHLHGHSLKPLLKDTDAVWRDAAISQYIKTQVVQKQSSSGKKIRRRIRNLGTSVRTDRFRFTRWIPVRGNQVTAEELVDFENDPGAQVNVAADPRYAKYLPRLRELADQSATGVAPPVTKNP